VSAVAGTLYAPRSRGMHRKNREPGLTWAWRTGAVVLSLGLSAALVREITSIRIVEAWLSGHVIRAALAVRAGAVPGAPIVWFAAGHNRFLGLLITPDCTVATLIIPFVLCTGWVVWHQVRLVRPLAALSVAVALLLAINQLRLLLITWLIFRLGYSSGFYWGHTMIGSLITVFGVVLVFLVYAPLATRKKAGRHHQRKTAPANLN